MATTFNDEKLQKIATLVKQLDDAKNADSSQDEQIRFLAYDLALTHAACCAAAEISTKNYLYHLVKAEKYFLTAKTHSTPTEWENRPEHFLEFFKQSGGYWQNKTSEEIYQLACNQLAQARDLSQQEASQLKAKEYYLIARHLGHSEAQNKSFNIFLGEQLKQQRSLEFILYSINALSTKEAQQDNLKKRLDVPEQRKIIFENLQHFLPVLDIKDFAIRLTNDVNLRNRIIDSIESYLPHMSFDMFELCIDKCGRRLSEKAASIENLSDYLVKTGEYNTEEEKQALLTERQMQLSTKSSGFAVHFCRKNPALIHRYSFITIQTAAKYHPSFCEELVEIEKLEERICHEDDGREIENGQPMANGQIDESKRKNIRRRRSLDLIEAHPALAQYFFADVERISYLKPIDIVNSARRYPEVGFTILKTPSIAEKLSAKQQIIVLKAAQDEILKNYLKLGFDINDEGWVELTKINKRFGYEITAFGRAQRNIAPEKISLTHAQQILISGLNRHLNNSTDNDLKRGVILNLADRYIDGTAGKFDFPQAVTLLKTYLTLDEDNATIYTTLGQLYEFGGNGLKASIKDALHYYQTAANKGDVSAKLRLAELYGVDASPIQVTDHDERNFHDAQVDAPLQDIVIAMQYYVDLKNKGIAIKEQDFEHIQNKYKSYLTSSVSENLRLMIDRVIKPIWAALCITLRKIDDPLKGEYSAAADTFGILIFAQAGCTEDYENKIRERLASTWLIKNAHQAEAMFCYDELIRTMIALYELRLYSTQNDVSGQTAYKQFEQAKAHINKIKTLYSKILKEARVGTHRQEFVQLVTDGAFKDQPLCKLIEQEVENLEKHQQELAQYFGDQVKTAALETTSNKLCISYNMHLNDTERQLFFNDKTGENMKRHLQGQKNNLSFRHHSHAYSTEQDKNLLLLNRKKIVSLLTDKNLNAAERLANTRYYLCSPNIRQAVGTLAEDEIKDFIIDNFLHSDITTREKLLKHIVADKELCRIFADTKLLQNALGPQSTVEAGDATLHLASRKINELINHAAHGPALSLIIANNHTLMTNLSATQATALANIDASGQIARRLLERRVPWYVQAWRWLTNSASPKPQGQINDSDITNIVKKHYLNPKIAKTIITSWRDKISDQCLEYWIENLPNKAEHYLRLQDLKTRRQPQASADSDQAQAATTYGAVSGKLGPETEQQQKSFFVSTGKTPEDKDLRNALAPAGSSIKQEQLPVLKGSPEGRSGFISTRIPRENATHKQEKTSSCSTLSKVAN